MSVAPVFTGASSTLAASTFFSIPLPPLALCPAFPDSDYYGGSAPPDAFGRRWTYPDRDAGARLGGTRAGRFPCSLLTVRGSRRPAVPLRHRHEYAVVLPRGLLAGALNPTSEVVHHITVGARRVRP